MQRKEEFHIMMKFFGIGRLTRDPEIRYTTEEHKMVAHFGLAVNKPNGEADFYNVECWKNKAEFAQKYLQKGIKVALSGRLTTKPFVKKDTTTTSVVLVAEDIEFAEKKEANCSSLPVN